MPLSPPPNAGPRHWAAVPSLAAVALPVDVYPVGVLADLRYARRVLTGTALGIAPAERPAARRHALDRLTGTARYLGEQARAGEWRAVKNSFNGYLAEPRWRDGDGPHWTRCGTGWTEARARRRLARHLTRVARRACP